MGMYSTVRYLGLKMGPNWGHMMIPQVHTATDFWGFKEVPVEDCDPCTFMKSSEYELHQ